VSQVAALLQADPRAVAVARQLRAQQVAAARLGLVIPAEYIDDVARKIVQTFQVGDLRSIRPQWRYTQVEPAVGDLSPLMGDVLAYDDPRNPWAEVVLEDGTVLSYGGTLFETTALPAVIFGGSSDGKLVYWLKWADPPGVVFVYTSPVRSPGGFFDLLGDALRELAPLIGGAVTFGSLGPVLSAAIFGPATVAAYPVATAAFTNLTLQTALTGGDIEAAARSAAGSLVGAQFGDVVGTGLDSAQIGKVAAAAATAAVQGGDIDKAVVRTLINIGAQSVDDYLDLPPGDFTTMPVDYVDPWLSGDTGDWLTWDELGVDLDPASLDNALILNEDALDYLGIPVDTLAPDDAGNLTSVTGDLVEATDVTYAESMYLDEGGNVRDIYGNVIIEAADLPTLSETEIAEAMQTYMAQNDGAVLQPPQQQPQARPAALPPPATQVKMPNITDFTKTVEALGKAAATLASAARAFKTGTYTPPYTTSPNGTPRNTPPGVPIQRPDGSVVTNNGNGTQTVRYPDGRVVTMPSTVSGSTPVATSLLPGVSNQALLIGGAVLVGVVLLARR